MSNVVKFNFLGKNCIIDRSLENLAPFTEQLKNLNFDYQHNPLFLNQIHGNKVVVIDDSKKIYQKPLPKADALVTNIKKLPIAIITADCVPIIFYDEVAEIIAIAHAGWKGAKSNIIENTVQEVLNLGAKIENIKTIIGPCIRQKSYEVSQEFYDDFIKDNQKNMRFFIKSNKECHFLFDLPKYCSNRIANLGINKIKDQEIDTYSNERDWFSYRRSFHKKETDCGRNISCIILN